MVAEDTKPPSEDTPRPEANEVTPAPGKTTGSSAPSTTPATKPPSEDTPRPEANQVTPTPGKTTGTEGLPRVEPSSSTFPGAKEATTPRSEGGDQIP
jgi:hypothetical protein